VLDEAGVIRVCVEIKFHARRQGGKSSGPGGDIAGYQRKKEAQ
jgi:hypothetical protein